MKNKIITKWLDSWNNQIQEWDANKKEFIKNDPFLNGLYYSGKENKELINFALPEPYLGNPFESSAIILNLNPGGFIKELQDSRIGSFVRKGKAIEDYYKFARIHPYFNEDYVKNAGKEVNGGHEWWERKNDRINQLLNLLKIDAGSLHPFALEICPWHSKSFGSLKCKNRDVGREMCDYIYENVIKIAGLASEYSKLKKVVISIGRVYEDILSSIAKSGKVEKILTISNDSKLPKGILYPQKREGDSVKRHFSVWFAYQEKSYIFNTYAPGGNTSPSNDFNVIVQYIFNMIENHKSKH